MSITFNRKYAHRPPASALHMPQILRKRWPQGTTSHPIICQKDEWYKTAICGEWSIQVLSPSQNDNDWFLPRGIRVWLWGNVPWRERTALCHTLAAQETHSETREGPGTLSQLRVSTSGETQSWCCFPATQFAQTPSVSEKNWKTPKTSSSGRMDLKESYQVAVQHIRASHIVHWTLKK